MKAIIPCAGFGTRMNMAPDQSKEMLHDPRWDGRVIDYSINLANFYGIDPVIITRKEKQDLIAYTSRYEQVIIEPKGEWPRSIMASYTAWDDHNILLLPDTRFTPQSIVRDVQNALKLGAKSVICLHQVNDPTKWCVVEDYQIVEKPTESDSQWAMGVYGFTRDEGRFVFPQLEVRDSYVDLADATFLFLDSFIDITRTGKIQY